MDLNATNKEFYNAHAASFDKIPFEEVLSGLILKHLNKPNCQVLEIGSGAGALALWMTKLGHSIVCVEPAEKPATIAREKGLSVNVSTFQDYQAEQKFDCLLAISSLIHISKQEMPSQILKISECLKEEALAFVSFIEGKGEGYEDPTHTGKMRYFSKFSEPELKVMLSRYFSMLETHKIEVKRMNQSFLLFVLKLKPAI